MPYWHYNANTSWVGGLIMLIVMAIFLAGVVTVGIVLLRRYARPALPHHGALRILNERFARGEIDHEEYEQRRTALKQ